MRRTHYSIAEAARPASLVEAVLAGVLLRTPICATRGPALLDHIGAVLASTVSAVAVGVTPWLASVGSAGLGAHDAEPGRKAEGAAAAPAEHIGTVRGRSALGAPFGAGRLIRDQSSPRAAEAAAGAAHVSGWACAVVPSVAPRQAGILLLAGAESAVDAVVVLAVLLGKGRVAPRVLAAAARRKPQEEERQGARRHEGCVCAPSRLNAAHASRDAAHEEYIVLCFGRFALTH